MNHINDNNFKEEMKKTEKLVLVDFYAEWCPPCKEMAPVIEKVAKEREDDFLFMKIDIDKFPNTANAYGVTGVPFVALLNKGDVVSSFLGSRSEIDIKNFLDENIKKDFVCSDAVMDYEDYAQNHDINLNPDKKIVDAIIAGLLKNEDLHGARYCPCRRVTGNKKEDKKIICPCIYHKEEIENDGKCMCGLFVA